MNHRGGDPEQQQLIVGSVLVSLTALIFGGGAWVFHSLAVAAWAQPVVVKCAIPWPCS